MKILILVLAFALGFFSGKSEAQQAAVSRQPYVLNVPIVTANTDTAFSVPPNTVKIQLSVRGGDVKFTWNKSGGITGATYVTLKQGNMMCSRDVILSPAGKIDTLYFQGAVGGGVIVVEIVAWR